MLLNEAGEVKLTGFSSANNGYVWGYAGAEAREGKHSLSSVVYSFGLSTHFLIHGKPLYDKAEPESYF